MKDKLRTSFNSKLFWLQAAFLISLAASLGSLVLSNVMNLIPCELCWWQRAFMYPLPFIFGAALAKKRTDVFLYSFPLVVVGAGVALFHYILQMWPSAADVCGASIISCSERQIDIFGFITIPFGSLAAFVAIGFCLFMLRKAEDA